MLSEAKHLKQFKKKILHFVQNDLYGSFQKSQIITMQQCIYIVLFFVVIISGCGCTHTQTLTQEHLRADASRNIIVYLKDGRIIQFNSGDYAIIEENLGSIKGQGRLIINETTGEFKHYEGTIVFEEILKITQTGSTVLGSMGIYTLLGISAVLVLLVLFPPKFNGW